MTLARSYASDGPLDENRDLDVEEGGTIVLRPKNISKPTGKIF